MFQYILRIWKFRYQNLHSIINYFYSFKDSDLDVFIDIGDMYTGEQKQDTISQVQIVRKVAAILQKNKEFSGVLTVATARTPIVRVIHEPTSIDCDLSFRHGLSVENTKFLK